MKLQWSMRTKERKNKMNLSKLINVGDVVYSIYYDIDNSDFGINIQTILKKEKETFTISIPSSKCLLKIPYYELDNSVFTHIDKAEAALKELREEMSQNDN